jgi:hypothetical protein
MTHGAALHTRDHKQRQPGPLHARLRSAATALSDADLLGCVVSLARAEREATVELVAHLAELDERKLYLGQGYSSLFTYCTGALHLAEHAAYNRIEVARASREFPAILDRLLDGSLNLATARLLAPHLRPDNFEAVVAMAHGKSKREVEVLVAGLAPRPDVPSSVRRLPAPVPPVAGATVVAFSQGRPAPSLPEAALRLQGLPDACAPALPPRTLVAGTSPSGTAETFAAPPSSREAFVDRPADRPADRPVVAPLAPARYRVQFTMGEETHEKLRCVQDLLRREVPDGDPATIFDRALTLLLEDIGRKKLAETSKPRPVAGLAATSRGVPASVKRAVWMRDAGRCAFVGANGQRCTERAFLELHHREPYARGGEATIANITLRCSRHHAHETELAFGLRSVPVGARIVSHGAEPGVARCAPEPHPGERTRPGTSRGPRRADPNGLRCAAACDARGRPAGPLERGSPGGRKR